MTRAYRTGDVMTRICIGVALLLGVAAAASAQTPLSGDVTVQADYLPNRGDTAELRTRVSPEEVLDPTPKLLFTMSGFAEGLLARRGTPAVGVAGEAQAGTGDAWA